MTAATITDTRVPTGTWSVDPVHSTIGFAVKHFGVATVRGVFREFEGTIEIGTDLEFSRAYGTVRAGSVNTDQEQRDEYLRSADFFDAANHPELRFESKGIEAIADQTLRIVGELEMNGVTREIELEADVVGPGERMSREEQLNLKARTTLSRRDYGMKPTAALGSVNALVGDKVKLELDISAAKQG